jgi:integrase
MLFGALSLIVIVVYLLSRLIIVLCVIFHAATLEGMENMKSERERKARKDNRGRMLKKGEGQDKSGRYYYTYEGRDGKRHRIYNTDLVELREAVRELQRDINDGIDVDAGKRTLNEQFERYMKTKDIKESTRANYKFCWDAYVRDDIGKMRLTDVKKSDLQIFYKGLKDKGFAGGTIKICSNNLIHPTLELAVDDDIIRKNPNKGCMREYTDKPKEKEALTQEQQTALLEYVRESERFGYYYPLFQVMISTAMRIGEIAGLTWKDVDFKSRTISISHQVNYGDWGDGYKYHRNTPKTDAGNRIIPMTRKCYRALKMQREMQFSLGIDRGKEFAGMNNFVFTTTRGTPISGQLAWATLDRVTKDYNKDEEAKAEKEKRTPLLLPDISSHSLRHTGCTRLAETKMDIKSLQEFMGHSDIKTTMNVYNHMSGDRLKREVEEAEKKSGII